LVTGRAAAAAARKCIVSRGFVSRVEADVCTHCGYPLELPPVAERLCAPCRQWSQQDWAHIGYALRVDAQRRADEYAARMAARRRDRSL
jgi:hypothetical protein